MKRPLDQARERLVRRGRSGVRGRRDRRVDGSIPERVRTDPRKRGFPTPFDRAARGAARDLALGLLDDERFRTRGWFDTRACKALLDPGPERPAHDRALFSVLSLEVWARLFVDGDALRARGETR